VKDLEAKKDEEKRIREELKKLKKNADQSEVLRVKAEVVAKKSKVEKEESINRSLEVLEIVSKEQKNKKVEMEGELSQAMKNALAEAMGLTRAEESFINFMIEGYAYKGFDPKAFQKHLAMVFEKKIFISPAGTYMLDVGSQATERAIDIGQNFRLTMDFLLCLFNLRGNNVTKIEKTLKGQPHTLFGKIITAMGVKDNLKEGGNAMTTITLSRIAAALPARAVLMALQGANRQSIELDLTMSLAQQTVFAHSSTPSLLTTEQITSKYHFVTYLAAWRFNQLISSPKKPPSSSAAVWRYHRIALDSKAVTTNERITFWTDADELGYKPLTDAVLANIVKTVSALIGADLTKELNDFCRK
jgi:hypothetical protein